MHGDRAASAGVRRPRGARNSTRPGEHEAPASVQAALASPGRTLDSATREFFEPVLGVDLGSVRIHEGATAEASVGELGARAYTVGSDIVLGDEDHRPTSSAGRELMAHELVHVVQQGFAGSRGGPATLSHTGRVVQRQTSGPGTGNRKARRAGQPGGSTSKAGVSTRHPLFQWAGQSWTLDFGGDFVTSSKVARLLFLAGVLPPGFELKPVASDTSIALRWILTWQTGRLRAAETELTLFGRSLLERMRTGVLDDGAGGGGDEFAEDVWKREARREAALASAKQARRAHNQTYVPALRMTGQVALQVLNDGAYVAWRGMIFRLDPIGPTFPPDVDWIGNYPGGYFVWYGRVGDGRQLQLLPVSTNRQFWKDVVWFMLHDHDSLEVAADRFEKRWAELHLMMLQGLAGAFGSIRGFTRPRLGPQRELGGSRAREADRRPVLPGRVRTEPRNLREKLALDEARTGAGYRIMQGKIKQSYRFPEDQWAKMAHTHAHRDVLGNPYESVIHFWQNLETGFRKGFKFKN